MPLEPETPTPTRPHILVIEDNFLAATSLKATLEEHACDVTLPPATVAHGLQIAENNRFDAALLDIDIIGGLSFPIAETLMMNSCPVVFVTGYDNPIMIPTKLKHCQVIRKPIDQATVTTLLRSLFPQPNEGLCN